MAVHAHPDDESTSTGGVLARYARDGVRTVVVTCTNGELGDGSGGIKPGHPRHDPRLVAATRIAELRTACGRLGVSDLELLGYHDSGMLDWDQKDRPDVFCNVPLEAAADRVGALIERYRPQVVVSYDPDSTYQHPDHVHAARVAAFAARNSGVPDKVYAKAHGTTYWRRFREVLREVGVERPEPSAGFTRKLEDIERRISATVDVSQVVGQKREGLLAHASQLGSSLAAKLPADLFAYVFGEESYFRVDEVGDREDDLLAGL